jgi:hypothetical protein
MTIDLSGDAASPPAAESANTRRAVVAVDIHASATYGPCAGGGEIWNAFRRVNEPSGGHRCR